MPSDSPIRAFFFTIDCPRCGGPFEHVADGRATPAHTQTVVRCPACRTEYRVELQLRSLKADRQRDREIASL